MSLRQEEIQAIAKSTADEVARRLRGEAVSRVSTGGKALPVVGNIGLVLGSRSEPAPRLLPGNSGNS